MGIANVHQVATLSPTFKIEAIRNGFYASDADQVGHELGISQKDIFTLLGINQRTASRLLKENRLLDPAASERLLRVVEVEKHAFEIFQDQVKVNQWMTQHNKVLGSAPINLLDTNIGYEQVERILIAIEYGLPV